MSIRAGGGIVFELMPESRDGVVGVKATGKLTDADYKEFLVPKLEELFDRHGRLRLLFYMDERFEGWDLEAAWDDASLGLRHRADFDKIAMVGGPGWIEWFGKFGAFLVKGEIKTFPADALAAAWDWVKA